MSTISMRVTEEESRIIREYVAANQLNLSQFIRDSVLDRIEEDLQLDEERILRARRQMQSEEVIDYLEVTETLIRATHTL